MHSNPPRSDAAAIGAAGEALVMNVLFEKGCFIFKEIGGLSKIDLIAVYQNKTIKVQVKTKKTAGEAITVACAKNTARGWEKYLPDEVDVIACVILDRKQVIFSLVKEMSENLVWNFRLTPSRRPLKNQRDASEYTFERMINLLIG